MRGGSGEGLGSCGHMTRTVDGGATGDVRDLGSWRRKDVSKGLEWREWREVKGERRHDEEQITVRRETEDDQ